MSHLKRTTFPILIAFSIASCTTLEPTGIKTWKGNSESASLMRGFTGEMISCTDKMFDRMFCFSDKDLARLLSKYND